MTPTEQCNAPAVRKILDAASTSQILVERETRDGRRRVLLIDDRFVVKRFEFPTAEKPARRPWEREHAALTYLADPRLPRSYGYVEDRENGRRTICYVRSFVPGEPLTAFDQGSAAEAGTLLASLHDRRLVTDDALTQNFMRGDDGQLFFLDFGKSRIFRPRSPLLPVWIALEHCRFLRGSLAWDESLWTTFRHAYFAASNAGRFRETFVRGLTGLLLWQRRLRRRARR